MSDAIGKLYILLGLKSTIDEDSKKATAAANKTAVAVGAALTGVGIAAKMMVGRRQPLVPLLRLRDDGGQGPRRGD